MIDETTEDFTGWTIDEEKTLHFENAITELEWVCTFGWHDELIKLVELDDVKVRWTEDPITQQRTVFEVFVPDDVPVLAQPAGPGDESQP